MNTTTFKQATLQTAGDMLTVDVANEDSVFIECLRVGDSEAGDLNIELSLDGEHWFACNCVNPAESTVPAADSWLTQQELRSLPYNVAPAVRWLRVHLFDTVNPIDVTVIGGVWR